MVSSCGNIADCTLAEPSTHMLTLTYMHWHTHKALDVRFTHAYTYLHALAHTHTHKALYVRYTYTHMYSLVTVNAHCTGGMEAVAPGSVCNRQAWPHSNKAFK